MSHFNEAIDCIGVLQPVQQDADEVIAEVSMQPVCRLPEGRNSKICTPKNRGAHVYANGVHENDVSDGLQVRRFAKFSPLNPVMPARQTVAVYQVSLCTATKVLVHVHPENTVAENAKSVGIAIIHRPHTNCGSFGDPRPP